MPGRPPISSRLLKGAALGILALLGSCDTERAIVESGAAPTDGEGAASVAFVNGDVLTLDPVTRVEEAIAIRGNRIMRAGSTREILRLGGVATRVVDLEGRTLMPGFVDAHSHYLLSFGLRRGMGFDGAQDLAIRLGTTTVGELNVPEADLPGLLAWVEEGNLRMRVNAYLSALTDVCGNPVDDWWTAHSPSRRPEDLFWIAGVKAFSDGGACNQDAVSTEFAPGTGLGHLYLTADEVSDLVRAAEARGFQVAVHALGDRAIDVVLDGYDRVLPDGRNPFRHRIEHNFTARADQLPRYSEIGVIPIVFAFFFSGHMEFEFLGGVKGCPPAPRNHFYRRSEGRLRSFLDANPDLPVAWHNDNPPWPPVANTSDLHNAVTRVQAFNDGSGGVLFCDPPPWMATTAISVEEALTMMTLNSAYALGRDHLVGSLEPGKLADLVLLSENPLEVPGRDLFDLEVWMTMIDGKVEFCREGKEAFCPEVQTP